MLQPGLVNNGGHQGYSHPVSHVLTSHNIISNNINNHINHNINNNNKTSFTIDAILGIRHHQSHTAIDYSTTA
ncbi:unnamed protein product, partial [Nesidiocoris tenuis]